MVDDNSSDSDLPDNDFIKANVDIAAGIILAAMSLFSLYWLFPNYIVATTVENDVGPLFFPKLAAWMVLGLSMLLIVSRLKQLKLSEPDMTGMNGRSVLFEIGMWSTISVLSILGLLNIGFLFTSPLIIFLGAVACGYRNWLVIIIMTVTVPLVLSQAAWLIFTVKLP